MGSALSWLGDAWMQYYTALNAEYTHDLNGFLYSMYLLWILGFVTTFLLRIPATIADYIPWRFGKWLVSATQLAASVGGALVFFNFLKYLWANQIALKMEGFAWLWHEANIAEAAVMVTADAWTIWLICALHIYIDGDRWNIITNKVYVALVIGLLVFPNIAYAIFLAYLYNAEKTRPRQKNYTWPKWVWLAHFIICCVSWLPLGYNWWLKYATLNFTWTGGTIFATGASTYAVSTVTVHWACYNVWIGHQKNIIITASWAWLSWLHVGAAISLWLFIREFSDSGTLVTQTEYSLASLSTPKAKPTPSTDSAKPVVAPKSPPVPAASAPQATKDTSPSKAPAKETKKAKKGGSGKVKTN